MDKELTNEQYAMIAAKALVDSYKYKLGCDNLDDLVREARLLLSIVAIVKKQNKP